MLAYVEKWGRLMKRLTEDVHADLEGRELPNYISADLSNFVLHLERARQALDRARDTAVAADRIREQAQTNLRETPGTDA